jgi:hypothetical protein
MATFLCSRSVRFFAMIAILATILPGLAKAQGSGETATIAADSDNEAAGQAKVFKRVYSGWNGTFHLIDSGGTAHYYLKYWYPGECGDEEYYVRRAHLASLQFVNSDGRFLIYRSEHGDRKTIYWAFALRPSHCGLYEVYRGTRDGFRLYGRFECATPR